MNHNPVFNKVLGSLFLISVLFLNVSKVEAASSVGSTSFFNSNSAIINSIKDAAHLYGTLPTQVANSYSGLGQQGINMEASVLSSISDFLKHFFDLFKKPAPISTTTSSIVIQPNTGNQNNYQPSTISNVTTYSKNQPVTIVDPQKTTIIQSGVTEKELNQKLSNLDQELRTLIFGAQSGSAPNQPAPITNNYITYSGGSAPIGSWTGPSNSDITNIQNQINNFFNGFSTSTIAGNLYTGGNLTVNHDLTVNGNFNVSGTTTFTNTQNVNNLNASSSNITNLIFTNATGTNLSLANLSSTNNLFTSATSTNLFSTNLNGTNGNVSNFIFGNATGTNLFSTRITSTSGNFTSATSSNFFANNANFTNLTFTNSTSTGANVAAYFVATDGAANSTFAGNVGIGTTNPTAKLYVENDLDNATVEIFRLQNAGTNAGNTGEYLTFYSTNNENARIEGRSNSLRFGTGSSGSERMRIDANGNVGIGTTSPGSKLDVYNGIIQSSGASGGDVEVLNPTNQSASVGLSWLSNIARIRYGGTGSGNQGGFQIQGTGNAIKWAIDDSGNSTQPGTLTVSGAGNSSVAGNLGIATTTPFEKVTVVGNGYFTGNVTASNFINSGNATTTGTETAGNFVATNASATSTFAGSIVASNGQITGGAGGLTMYAGGTNQNITLAPSGSGVVTLFPINGGHYFKNQGTHELDIGIGGNDVLLLKDAGNNSTLVSAGLGLGSNNFNNTPSRWTTAGIVFGTGSTPDIGLTRNAAGIFEINNGSAGTFRDLIVRNLSLGTTSQSSTLTLQAVAGKDAVEIASSTGTSLFHITQAGNVGIGTTNTSKKLTVTGTTRLNWPDGFGNPAFDNGGVQIMINGSNQGTTYYTTDPTYTVNFADLLTSTGRLASISFNQQAGNFLEINNATSGPIRLLTNGSERMRIDSSGNVGIGTSTPLAKLAVAGGVHIGGVSDPGTNNLLVDGTIETLNGGAIRSGNGGLSGMIQINGATRIISSDSGNILFSANILTPSGGQDLGAAGSQGWRDLYLLRNATIGGTIAVTGTSTFTGNVGIGTSSPTANLHVAGVGGGAISNGSNPLLYVQSTSSYGGMSFGAPTGQNVFLELLQGTTKYGLLHMNAGAGRIELGSMQNYPLTLGASSNNTFNQQVTILPSGNVGIGTTNPQYKLDVNGGANFNTIANFNNEGGSFIGRANSIMELGSISDIGFIPNNGGQNGTQALIIKSSGNVGIGTTTPGSKLDVWGNLNVATGTTPALFVNTATGNVGIGTNSPQNFLNIGGSVPNGYWYGSNIGAPVTGIFQSDSNTTLANNIPALTLYNFDETANNFNQIVFASRDLPGNAVGIASIAAQAGTRNGNWGTGQLIFSTSRTGVGNTEAMRIDGNGNVGIGTTTPSTPLSVAYSDNNFVNGLTIRNANTGSSAFSGVQVVRADGTNGGFGLVNSNWAFSFPNTAQFYSNVGLAFTSDNTSGNSPTNSISFATGALTRMTILASGNVGIGTSSPSQKLDVWGNLNVATGTTPALFVNTATGNVGIGTTNPGSPLSVEPTSRPTNGWITKMLYSGLTTAGGSNTVGYVLGRDASNYNLASIDFNYVGTNSTSNYTSFGMYGLATPAIVYNGAGNVGIGTSTPTYPLTVSAAGTDVARFYGSAGTAQCTVVAGTGWSCSSDERLKQNINPLSDSLNKVLALQGVTYNWRQGDTTTTQVGFIAQDVEKTIPELVRTDANGYKSLLYAQVGPYLVEAIKGLNQKVDDKNASTTAAFASLDLRVKSLESLNIGGGAAAGGGGPGLGADLLSALQSFGAEMLNGIAYVSHLFTKQLTVGAPSHPNGITLYDQVTGDPYCVVIRNGAMVNVAGECQDVTATSTTQGSGTVITVDSNNNTVVVPDNTSGSSNGSTISSTSTDSIASTSPNSTISGTSTDPAPEPLPSEPAPPTDSGSSTS